MVFITATGTPIPSLATHTQRKRINASGGPSFVELLLSKAIAADAASPVASGDDSSTNSSVQRDLLNAMSALSLQSNRPAAYLFNFNERAEEEKSAKKKVDLFSLTKAKLEVS